MAAPWIFSVTPLSNAYQLTQPGSFRLRGQNFTGITRAMISDPRTNPFTKHPWTNATFGLVTNDGTYDVVDVTGTPWASIAPATQPFDFESALDSGDSVIIIITTSGGGSSTPTQPTTVTYYT